MTFANYSQVSKVLKTFAHVTYFYVICTKAYPIVLEYMPPSRNLSAKSLFTNFRHRQHRKFKRFWETSVHR